MTHQRLPAEFPPPFAHVWGDDAYGLWATFTMITAFGQSISQTLRWIEPGGFWMGSPETEPGRLPEETRHWVELSRGFWLADTACTQLLWEAVMGKNPSSFQQPDKPVENVSWHDVQEFLAQLRQLWADLRWPCRLPSEAEWEYACRAGTDTAFAFAEPISPALVNYRGTGDLSGDKWGEGALRETAVVKAYPPNRWGLYQMHGNVWEWCQDWYADYPPGAQTDPAGPDSGERRVLRGGSWFFSDVYCRAASRSRFEFGDPSRHIGFRFAISPGVYDQA